MAYFAFRYIIILIQFLVLFTDFQGSYVQVTITEASLGGDRKIAHGCQQNQLDYLGRWQ